MEPTVKSPVEYIVPWVRQSEPYSAKHMDVAWENPDIVRMMSNENLLPPSEKVLQAVFDAARQGNLYPGSGPELRSRLGEMNGLQAENVVLGDGSTDVINFVINTFVAPGDEVVISVPTFPMYESRVRISGGVPVLVPMTPDFYWDIPALLAAITPRTKLMFICSPNNPTGNQIAERDLLTLLETGIPMFFDEAYYELEDHPLSRVYLMKEHAHMMVNRTLSKAWGLAGFRIGYLLCGSDLANYFNRVKISWNVGLVALAAALAGIEDEEDAAFKRQTIIDGREMIYEEINTIPGLKAFASEGNFVLIDASALGRPSAEIVAAMRSRGIFLRPMAGHHMPLGFIRVTVGDPAQNRSFLDHFKQYVLGVRGG
jgi:histidinol-phosphate aminotransferase